jgi:uncharacterized protein with FMN-binding domain
MKRRYLFFALIAVAAAACQSSGKKPEARVASLSLQVSPERKFNNEPLLITLSTATPDAAIYYTLDGSVPAAGNGTLYTGPFYLKAEDAADTDYRGYVQLRAAGTKDGFTNSSIVSQVFQIFPREQILGADGKPANGGPQTGTATGYYAPVNVTLSLADGYITDIKFVNVDNGQTDTFWSLATKFAREFFTVMNSPDFVPAVSGASYSGNGVRNAAKDAIGKILGK